MTIGCFLASPPQCPKGLASRRGSTRVAGDMAPLPAKLTVLPESGGAEQSEAEGFRIARALSCNIILNGIQINCLNCVYNKRLILYNIKVFQNQQKREGASGKNQ